MVHILFISIINTNVYNKCNTINIDGDEKVYGIY